MYDPKKCDLCGKCLARCQYMDFDEKSGAAAIKELASGKTPEWLNSCITCFACSETCPNSADPFDLIVTRMEQSGAYLDPALVAAMHGHFSPKGDYTPAPAGEKAVSLCTIYSVLPPETFTGRLFEGLTPLRGRFFFCHILYLHLGNKSFFEKEMGPAIERIAATGAKEVVFVHDDCYTMIRMAQNAGVKIPFKPVHLLEHLRDWLKSNTGSIKPINKTLAYQRPCASRLTAEKEALVDEIFELIGAKRAEREFDREKALCCGQNTGDALAARKNMGVFQDKNIADAVQSGADGMAFLCPMCMGALGEKAKNAGLKTWFISDLCRAAIGEI
jgi:Fe-S oxidoreductase